MVWFQTAFKGYPHRTKVAASKECIKIIGQGISCYNVLDFSMRISYNTSASCSQSTVKTASEDDQETPQK